VARGLAIELFSDGGGERSSSAGGACIVRDTGTGRERRFALFLGGGTNNESEIAAGLTGFSFLRALEMTERLPVDRVRWVSDSEYVLKSASEYINTWQTNGWRTSNRKPVKNQGLWRAYLALSEGLRIEFQHVRGHAGHAENEACDVATTWLQMHGEEFLAEQGEGASVEVSAGPFGNRWTVMDGRAFLEALRTDNPALDRINLLANRMQTLEISSFPDGTRPDRRPFAPSPSSMLIARLEELKNLAEKLRGSDPAGELVYETLGELLARLSAGRGR
jgi:ribonuclease HI